MFLLLLPAWVVAGQDSPGDFQDGILIQQIDPVDDSQIQLSQTDIEDQAIGFGYREVMEKLRSRVASGQLENYIGLTQSGSDNTAIIFQEGKYNAMEIEQLGNNNLYELSLNGEENLIHVLQTGHYNKLYQILEGDGIGLQVTQQGSDLELVQIETGGNAPAYRVDQRGEGMSIRIEYNQIMLPFTGGN